MINKSTSIPKLHVRYKRFQKNMKDVWESFLIVEFYTPKIKELIKNDLLPSLTIDTFTSDSIRVLNKDNTYGALSSLERRGNFRRTLLEAILIFEDYMSDLIELVYLDLPNKLTSKQDNNENHQKILNLILNCSSKDEMIEMLVEEKIRKVFYGNPLDVFEKDKAKLNFGSFFKDNCSLEIKKLKEIIATRNIIAHNNGKVDRKYLRETDATVNLGSVIKLNREVIKDSVYILYFFATHSARLVVENIYKETPSGNLGKAINSLKK
ncbi:TPA: hypothetical protein RG419_001375 [Morganella morganii]|nr:hypothetical protein [Morganella morganii]